MLKKILLPISVAGVMFLAACNDDSSSTSAPESGSGSAKVTCKVNVNTSDRFKMTIAVPDSGSTSMEFINGANGIKFINTVEFDKSISSNLMQAICEEAKNDAKEDGEGEEVSCSGNTMTMTSMMDPEDVEDFGKAMKEMENECNTIQRTGVMPEFGDDEDWDYEKTDDNGDGDDKPTSPIETDPTKVSCVIKESSDDKFLMTVSIPDSAVVDYEVVYTKGNAHFSIDATFDKSIPASEVKAFCDEMKEDGDGAEVTCKDNNVSTVTKIDDDWSSLLSLYSMVYAEACREIQETGTLPDDLFGDDDDEEDWGEGWDWDDDALYKKMAGKKRKAFFR